MQAPLPRFRPGKMQLRSIFAFASWIALGFLMKRLDDFVVERMKYWCIIYRFKYDPRFWKVVNLDEEVNNNILLLLAVFAHVFVALFIRYLAAAMVRLCFLRSRRSRCSSKKMRVFRNQKFTRKKL